MARAALGPQKKQDIKQAKRLLRTLLLQSQLKQQEVLEALSKQGLQIKKNTLSNWFSESDLKRPPLEALSPILHILAPSKSPEDVLAIYDELSHLLGYQRKPESAEHILNQISQHLNHKMTERLLQQRLQLEDEWPPLLDLLYELDEQIFEYDRSFPVLRLEHGEIEKHLLIKNKALYENYRVSGGYEIPLTKVASADLLTSIINQLHEGVRVLRAYVEKNLLSEAPPGDHYPLFEELLKYIWEIVNRLLFNPLCQQDQEKKRTLLSVVGTCQGIYYLLDSLKGHNGLIKFQNMLQLKGMSSPAEIHCSMAVYVGVVARQTLNAARKNKDSIGLKRGLTLFKEAFKALEVHHQKRHTEQTIYYYKKEMANLAYDIASLLLWFDDQSAQIQDLMTLAHDYYAQVIETINLFQAGLSEHRAAYIQAFYTITKAWCGSEAGAVQEQINQLNPGPEFNEDFWVSQIAKAISYGVLHLRFTAPGTESSQYLVHMKRAYLEAKQVPGRQQELNREMEQDYILHAFRAYLVNPQPKISPSSRDCAKLN